MGIKVSVSLSDECIAQLESLRDTLHLSPMIRRSTLIQQIIWQCYMDHQRRNPAPMHGSPSCDGDCDHCADEPICDYSRCIDRFMI